MTVSLRRLRRFHIESKLRETGDTIRSGGDVGEECLIFERGDDHGPLDFRADDQEMHGAFRTVPQAVPMAGARKADVARRHGLILAVDLHDAVAAQDDVDFFIGEMAVLTDSRAGFDDVIVDEVKAGFLALMFA